MPCDKLLDYLIESRVEWEMIEHPKAYAADDVAHKVGVPEEAFAKTVMVKLDGLMAMAVVPSRNKVNFNLLREAAGAETIALAVEDDFGLRFPDCELGAMPPFGNLYGLNVFVDGGLAEQEGIAFNAGTHLEVIKMDYTDFEDLVQPRLARFAYRDLREMKTTS